MQKTLFSIRSSAAADIGAFSAFSGEEELIFFPGTVLEVLDVKRLARSARPLFNVRLQAAAARLRPASVGSQSNMRHVMLDRLRSNMRQSNMRHVMRRFVSRPGQPEAVMPDLQCWIRLDF